MSFEVKSCREQSCRARIVWLPTKSGSQMPVDADTVGPDDTMYDARRHTSYFKTCTKPNKFSGSKKRCS